MPAVTSSRIPYREFGNLGFETSVLGFGCMRLPCKSKNTAEIDFEEARSLIRYAIDRGVNYIDTAFPYHMQKSEPFLGEALKDGYRGKIKLATKFPSWLIQSSDDFDRFLDEQLRRLQTSYIDLYLMHGLSRQRWDKLKDHGVFEAIDRYKKTGRIHFIGFSFHDDLDAFRYILDDYDWDFCQIQYNYMNEDYQAGTQGLRYAAAKGKPIVVMEPLLGGRLARTPPDAVRRLWDASEKKRSPAEWALDWVWNHPEVSVVLSGMNSRAQVEANLEYAGRARPGMLADEELARIRKVRDAYRSLSKIDCTGCKYCLPCPYGIDIPQNFTFYNEAFMYNDREGRTADYLRFTDKAGRAANCRACGRCEKICPQHLPIRSLLKDVAAFFPDQR